MLTSVGNACSVFMLTSVGNACSVFMSITFSFTRYNIYKILDLTEELKNIQGFDVT
jgi:hypothetical protein